MAPNEKTTAARPHVVPYSTGTPSVRGVYACRLEKLGLPGWLEDEFLMWDGEWWYLYSSERCRREVLGWVGPLQRKMV